MGLSQNRVSEIIGNTIFGNIDTLLSQGHDMEYIARHYTMDLPLAWALRLERKGDQEKFKALGWGLRTWDQANAGQTHPGNNRKNPVNRKKGIMNGSNQAEYHERTIRLLACKAGGFPFVSISLAKGKERPPQRTLCAL